MKPQKNPLTKQMTSWRLKRRLAGESITAIRTVCGFLPIEFKLQGVRGIVDNYQILPDIATWKADSRGSCFQNGVFVWRLVILVILVIFCRATIIMETMFL